MANFAAIGTTLEGILNTQLNLARSHQGVWEWYNALSRIMSANRFTGTPRIDGPVQLTATDRDVEAAAVLLFGLLVDNTQAAEDAFIIGYNTNTVTEGTTDFQFALWAPRNAIQCYVFPNGIDFATAYTLSDSLGTTVGIEAGTLSTTHPTVLSVYTE